jgi:hypothetical protein
MTEKRLELFYRGYAVIRKTSYFQITSFLLLFLSFKSQIYTFFLHPKMAPIGLMGRIVHKYAKSRGSKSKFSFNRNTIFILFLQSKLTF